MRPPTQTSRRPLATLTVLSVLALVPTAGLSASATAGPAVRGPAAASAPRIVHVDRPPVVLGGPSTGLADVRDVDTVSGRTYVLQDDRIEVFRLGDRGDTAPFRTVTGPATTLSDALRITVDTDGYVYVLELDGVTSSSSTVVVFAPDADGDAVPVGRYSDTLLSPGPSRFVTDLTAVGTDVAVLDLQNTSIGVFDLRGRSAVPDPVRTIGPGNAALDDAEGIAAAPDGRILAVGPGFVERFADTAAGADAPVAVVSGARTRIASATSTAIDSRGALYVASVTVAQGVASDPRVLVFAPGSRGDVAPSAVLGGSASHLSTGSQLDVAPDRSVHVFPLRGSGGLASVGSFGTLGPYAVPGRPGRPTVSGPTGAARRTISWTAARAGADVPVTSYAVGIVCGRATVVRTVGAGARSITVRRGRLRAGSCTAAVKALNVLGGGPVAARAFRVAH